MTYDELTTEIFYLEQELRALESDIDELDYKAQHSMLSQTRQDVMRIQYDHTEHRITLLYNLRKKYFNNKGVKRNNEGNA